MRALRLRREVLTELGVAELVRVNAGQQASFSPTCPLDDCLTRLLTAAFENCGTFGSCLSCRASCEC